MKVELYLKKFLFILALFITNTVLADYYIFAGGHVGYTYYDEINTDTVIYDLDKGQVGNTGFDVLAAWGTQDYGIGLTYTSGNHVVKTKIEGIRVHQKMSGPGIIFSSIYKNPQDAKTIAYIGVESLTLNTSNTSCVDEAQCDQLEKDLDGSTATSIILGIIDTASSGFAIGIVGRAYESDAIKRGYDLNLLIGFAL